MNLLNKIVAQKGGNRIAVNTIIIYGQRFAAAILSLITTPILLSALGVEDYGLYAMTVGLVGTLSFINWSLSSTTQRFIAYSIGAGDREKLKRIFASSFLVHGFYALLVLLIIWLFGGFLAEKYLTIPDARLDTAKIIIKIVSVVTFFEVISVPFTGLFRAHENFLYLAIIGVTHSVFKLGIALSLKFVNPNRLIFYSICILVISLIIFFANVFFSKRFHSEVNFLIKNIDRAILSEMMSFMGWSLLGAVAIMSRNQGVSVLLNIFFGVVANAAYGIAMQVNYAMGMLSQGFSGSISPQIIKSAGAGETDKMIYLMRTMSKFTLISVSLVSIPLLFETPLILKLWLRIIPEGTIIFTRLIITFSMVMLFSAGIQTVFESIGKVKLYNIWVSLILMLNLPLAFLFFKLDFPSYTIILTGIFLEAVCLIVRLCLLKKYLNFSIFRFLNDVVVRILTPVSVIAAIILLIQKFVTGEYYQLGLILILILSLYPVLIYHLSLDQRQKAFALETIARVFKSIKRIL